MPGPRYAQLWCSVTIWFRCDVCAAQPETGSFLSYAFWASSVTCVPMSEHREARRKCCSLLVIVPAGT